MYVEIHFTIVSSHVRKKSKNEVKVSEDVQLGKKHVFCTLLNVDVNMHGYYCVWRRCHIDETAEFKISKITIIDNKKKKIRHPIMFGTSTVMRLFLMLIEVSKSENVFTKKLHRKKREIVFFPFFRIF